ncbi:hypothetical protein DAPPUDRAFT_234081 [Daphnia pulex]|uniref:Uncharacterized protein n=1 Tax=Daphnia pulex TaxID=6669 RepID=E9FUI5_DAPPU|nr:hypothetical protein DAPPUDRAFT_234081 [Daphnia pulex]|eukprot:EFX88918.1 hypothetical protein DAPPUDRAFT_234081 [Daphnia pulex]
MSLAGCYRDGREMTTKPSSWLVCRLSAQLLIQARMGTVKRKRNYSNNTESRPAPLSTTTSQPTVDLFTTKLISYTDNKVSDKDKRPCMKTTHKSTSACSADGETPKEKERSKASTHLNCNKHAAGWTRLWDT